MSLRTGKSGRFRDPSRGAWIALAGLALALAAVGSLVLLGGGRSGDRAEASSSADAGAATAVARASASAARTIISPSAPVSSPTAASGFTRAASMTTGRSGHTATRLNDGRVLITDQTDGSAEVFDPAIGTFTTTGSMKVARRGYSATLLADGTVLVAGGSGTDPASGSGSGPALDSAEIYDPTTGTFAPTAPMTQPRTGHTATLLADGSVLIAGGQRGQGAGSKATATAELYDPATGRFSATGSMAGPRLHHTATLLTGGRVLIACGDTSGGTVGDTSGVAAGDIVGGAAIATAELYDPTTGKFVSAGAMKEPRAGHTATLLLDGRVLVAGGVVGGVGIVPTAELYSPDTGLFTATGLMVSPRVGPAALLPDGRVLFTGGSGLIIDATGLGRLRTAELFDPATGKFTATSPMITARIGHTATLLQDGRVLIAGGMEGLAPLTFAELYSEPKATP